MASVFIVAACTKIFWVSSFVLSIFISFLSNIFAAVIRQPADGVVGKRYCFNDLIGDQRSPILLS